MRRRARMVELARELLGGSFAGGVRVGVLGAAFKPNSDDVRDSPALDVASPILKRMGATVCVYDPAAMDNARARYPDLQYCDSAIDAVAGRRRGTAPDRVARVPRHGSGRTDRRWSRTATSSTAATPSTRIGWRTAGWTYRALGRP